MVTSGRTIQAIHISNAMIKNNLTWNRGEAFSLKFVSPGTLCYHLAEPSTFARACHLMPSGAIWPAPKRLLRYTSNSRIFAEPSAPARRSSASTCQRRSDCLPPTTPGPFSSAIPQRLDEARDCRNRVASRRSAFRVAWSQRGTLVGPSWTRQVSVGPLISIWNSPLTKPLHRRSRHSRARPIRPAVCPSSRRSKSSLV